MDERLKEELIYQFLSTASVIAVPLEDSTYMFVFKIPFYREPDVNRLTSFQSKRVFLSTIHAVFYKEKIIERKTGIGKFESGQHFLYSSDSELRKFCDRHFRKIIACPEILMNNLFDDKIVIKNPQYITPIKNLMRELGLIKKRGRLRKYGPDKVKKVRETYDKLLELNKGVIKEYREIVKGRDRLLSGSEIKMINKKLPIQKLLRGEFRFDYVSEVVLYGPVPTALAKTSKLEKVPPHQLNKMLYSRKYKEKILG